MIQGVTGTNKRAGFRLRPPSIVHAYQKQAVGWRSWTSSLTVPRGEDPRDSGGWQPPRAYLHQRANQVAHHVPKEAIARDADDERHIESGSTLPFDGAYGAFGRGHHRA